MDCVARAGQRGGAERGEGGGGGWGGEGVGPAGLLQLLQLVLQPLHLAFQLGLHTLGSFLSSCSLILCQLHAACQLSVFCILDPAAQVITDRSTGAAAAGITQSSVCTPA